MTDQESPTNPVEPRKRGCKLHGCWKVLLFGVLLVIGCRMLPYSMRGGAIPFSVFDVPWNELAFDSAQWKSRELYGMSRESEGKDMKRGMMLYDLLDNHIRIGMTMERARELLGEPDSPGNSGRRWTYELGMWSGFRFEMDFLVLRFYEDGRLFEFFFYQG